MNGIINVHTHDVSKWWPNVSTEAGPDAQWLKVVERWMAQCPPAAPGLGEVVLRSELLDEAPRQHIVPDNAEDVLWGGAL